MPGGGGGEGGGKADGDVLGFHRQKPLEIDAADHAELAEPPGEVEDTLVVDAPIALAHVDVDWYDPVMTCLERIAPHLSVGGIIVLDDYFDWSGCRKATDDFLKNTPFRFTKDTSAGSMALIKH